MGEERGWQSQGAQTAEAVRDLLEKVRSLKSLESERSELKRKKTVDSSRVQKIFQNQERLRENIKSMEHVRTGTLLDRYMNDMDKEESDLIETRARIERAEEEDARLESSGSKLALQISMAAKQMRKRCSMEA